MNPSLRFSCTYMSFRTYRRYVNQLETDTNGRVLVTDRLVGLVVKASASRAEDPGFQSRLRWDFFGVG